MEKQKKNTKGTQSRKKQSTKASLKSNPAQKIMLVVVALALIVTAVGIILSAFLSPEPLSKSRISSLAADYYENYIYEDLINSENYSGDLESTMSRYVEKGFSPVTLRQLVLHDQAKTAAYAKELTGYCDEDLTYVRYYPQPPYGRTDYRVEYNYICNF